MEKKAMKSFCSNEDAARWAAVLNDEDCHEDDREDIFTQENIKVKMQNLRQHQKMGAHNKTPRWWMRIWPRGDRLMTMFEQHLRRVLVVITSSSSLSLSQIELSNKKKVNSKKNEEKRNKK